MAGCLKATAGVATFKSVAATDSMPAGRYEYSLQRMGTLFRMILHAPDENTASLAAQAAFDRVEQLEQSMSDYRQDSEIRRICREAVWTAKPLSAELYFVLERSLYVSRLTGGAFDVTVGPVVAVWREARRSGRLPDPEVLSRAKEAVGYENVELDAASHTILLKRRDMRLDLGGIAKGFGADVALQTLNSRGIRSAMIDAGGDLVLGDPPPGERGWKVEVQTPPEPVAGHLVLRNLGIATSGDAYQHLDAGGRRYSHIVNPANGLGITNSISTTVLAPDGITADALATAMSVMPVAEALKVADSVPGVSAFLLRRLNGNAQRFSSSRFPRLL